MGSMMPFVVFGLAWIVVCEAVKFFRREDMTPYEARQRICEKK